MTLLFGFVGIVCWTIALLSYSPLDSAWSTSGSARLVEEAGLAITNPWRNWLKMPGAWLADLSYYSLGFSIWWVVAIALHQWILALARRLDSRAFPDQLETGVDFKRFYFWLALFFLLLASAGLEWSRLYRYEDYLPGTSGGILGAVVGATAFQWMGFTGSGLLFISLATVAMPLVFGFSWARVVLVIGSTLEGLVQARRQTRERAEDQALGRRASQERGLTGDESNQPALKINRPAPRITVHGVNAQHHTEPETEVISKQEELHSAFASTAAENPISAASPEIKPDTEASSIALSTSAVATTQKQGTEQLAVLQPSLILLDPPSPVQEMVASETLEMTSRLIEKKLRDFGVEVRVLTASPGPVVTRFEIEPALGVKGAQVVGLARDLARALSLVSIRVIETIPGKNCMAMELPNARRQSIRLCEILDSPVFTEAISSLTIGLGQDIAGQPVVADLAKMPHCLVAGTTGSGKSVGINAMILSLLFKATPQQVRLLLIDPKMLEMGIYEGIPHLLCPVVTDMRKAANGLNWCVGEMDRRYRLLSKAGVRSLASYNAQNPFEALPFIVVVIDELADLMMVGGKKIEELIARLAQKARAAGIHLVLATQRPSVDVITGLIKANIPTRLSFQVASKIDSRTILDQMGAETLLGMGDMLYQPAGSSQPLRLHGAFVSDDEVHRVVAYLKKQGTAPHTSHYIEGILDEPKPESASGNEGPAGGGSPLDKDSNADDPLLDKAVAVVMKHRKASISLVQQHLRIGYNRAARLLNQMQTNGLVGALQPNGQREILQTLPDSEPPAVQQEKVP